MTPDSNIIADDLCSIGGGRRENTRPGIFRRYSILDTLPDSELDVLTTLATQLFKVEYAAISLLDDDRQWFKSSCGIGVSETERDVAFCDHTVRSGEPMVVLDATQDVRFKDNPLVTGPMSIRFYAGVPLVAPDGEAFGAFCIIGTSARMSFTSEELHMLEMLADSALTTMTRKYFVEKQDLSRGGHPSRALFEAFIREVPLAVAMIDSDLKYIAVSKKWYELYEIDSGDVIGKSHFDVVKHISPNRQERLQQLLDQDEVESGREVSIQQKDGSSTWIRCDSHPWRDDAGQIGGLVLYRSVIDKEMAARAEVQRKKEQYRAIYNETPAMMYSIDGDGTIVRVSDFWLERMGYHRNEVVGRNATEFMTPSSKLFIEKEVRPVARRRGLIADMPIELVKKDGGIIQALVSSNAEIDKFGSVSLRNAILVDVTEKMEVEEALRQTQKMDVLGNLTGGIAHDFNNILAIVMGNLQLIERMVQGEDNKLERVHSALEATRRGADLTKQLLTFSRRQKLNPARINVNDTITGLHDMISRTIASSVDLTMDLGDIHSEVYIDPGLLQNALLNLVINARDAIGDHGSIVVESRETEVGGLDVSDVDRVEPGKYVVVSVSDDGCGMSEDVRQHVLEPFFTTKEAGKGTGLGLPMVYGFIRQSGGYLSLFSEVGRGTTVRLYLPIGAPGLADEPNIAPELESGCDKGARILVVEDDAAVRGVVCAMVVDLGHTYIEAASASEALGILDSDDAFDLVFTDIVMSGGMNGVELAKTISQRGIDVPVLLTSGYPRDAVDGEDPIYILQKPYQQDELADEIRRLVPNRNVTP